LEKAEQRNFLLTFPEQKNNAFAFLRPWDRWKIISGDWTKQLTAVRLDGNDPANQGESLAILGRRDWTHIEFQAGFRFLTGTIKPPDGGAILFFLARNTNNHLAFHFCIGKNRIQLFKKARGTWAMLGEETFEFELNKHYTAKIRTESGVHHCLMDDGTCLQIEDSEIFRGRIGIGGKLCSIEFDWLSLASQPRSISVSGTE
jgi:hypothetical protein